MGHNKIRVFTRVICPLMVLAFVGGIVPDIDHPLAEALGINNGRFMHSAFAILGFCLLSSGLIILIAYLRRLSKLWFLKGSNDATIRRN